MSEDEIEARELEEGPGPSIRKSNYAYSLSWKVIKFICSYDVDLPEEGIISPQGYLFHHVVPGKVTEEQTERLLQYGIKLDYNVRFTREEDKRIRKNWRQFAARHGFAYEDGQYYAGFMAGADGTTRSNQRRENDVLVQLGMWPHICRKLETRSADQVQRRMIHILDPYYTGTPDPFTEAEVSQIYRMISDGKSLIEISIEMRRPSRRILNEVSRRKREWKQRGFSVQEVLDNPELLEQRKMHPRHYRRLFYSVLRNLGMSELILRDTLKHDRSLDWLNEQMINFNWVPLIPCFGLFNEKNMKDTWNILTTNLLKAFLRVADIEGADIQSAWWLALKETMPIPDRSLDSIISYVHQLRKCVHKEAGECVLRNVDQKKLAKKLFRLGLVDSPDYEPASCQFFGAIMTVLKSKDKFILRHLEYPLSFREKVRIVEKCYERMKSMGREDVTKEHLRLPSIGRIDLVEVLTTEMRRLEPEWRPPKLFQRWIRSPELVDLFDKHSDNSELRNPEEDLRVVRKMTFADSRCLRALPFSCGAAEGLIKALGTDVPSTSRAQQVDEDSERENDVGVELAPAPRRKRGWGEEPKTGGIAQLEIEENGLDETPVIPEKDRIRRKKRRREGEDIDEPEEAAEEEQEGNDVVEDRANISIGLEFDETILAGAGHSFKDQNAAAPALGMISPIPRSSPDPMSDPNETIFENEDDKLKHLRVTFADNPVAPSTTENTQKEDAFSGWMDIFS